MLLDEVGEGDGGVGDGSRREPFGEPFEACGELGGVIGPREAVVGASGRNRGRCGAYGVDAVEEEPTVADTGVEDAGDALNGLGVERDAGVDDERVVGADRGDLDRRRGEGDLDGLDVGAAVAGATTIAALKVFGPVFILTNGERIGRDGCRVPLPWTDDPSTAFGFSSVADDEQAPEPWLPQPAWWGVNAVDELDGDDDSMLELYRAAIGARKDHATPQGLVAAVIELGDGLVAVRRGDLLAVTNVTSAPIALDMDDPHLEIASPVFTTEPNEMHTPGVIAPDSTIWFLS